MFNEGAHAQVFKAGDVFGREERPFQLVQRGDGAHPAKYLNELGDAAMSHAVFGQHCDISEVDETVGSPALVYEIVCISLYFTLRNKLARGSEVVHFRVEASAHLFQNLARGQRLTFLPCECQGGRRVRSRDGYGGLEERVTWENRVF